MSLETDAPAPSTEIAAGTPSSLVEPPPAGQDGRNAQEALDVGAKPGPVPIPQPSSKTTPTKQSLAQRHASATFYRSCEISLMEPVGSMSISPANRDVVLAARKGLFIIDLEDPFAPPRFLAHMTTWEAVDIQWSPHPARSNWVASTSNQKLLIWNLDRPGDPRAAPPMARLPLRSSIHSISSPVISTNAHFQPSANRGSAYQAVFNSHSVQSGLTAGTSAGLGPVSATSPYPGTPLSAGSHMYAPATRSSAIEHVLHAHTRAITDINWSPFHPEIVASSSIDTWTWVWDLRMSGTSDGSGRRKPAQGYSAWNAAVTQVKFNRASEHRLASTCDNKVLIWDDRKGSLPLATIEAHESKIYGIDWSRDTSLGLDRLVTCSLDRTVKFWDLASDTSQAAIGARELVTEAESMIETRTPVWRARHLPFGNGVMTLPQRGDTVLSMWAKDKPDEPQATFAGHTDIVKEYLFRTKGGQNRDCDNRQFQLITWSKDQTLRLWPVTDEQTEKVGHRPNAPIRVLMTRANAPDISYRDPPLVISSQVEDDAAIKSQGSASNITVSSLLPPERATRSLLSGKGSGSRINAGSPYSSSTSGFQGGMRDGRTSPAQAFSSSYGGGGRSLNHSSSHGNLSSGFEALSRSPMDTYGRSLGKVEAAILARSLPKQSDKGASSYRLATSHHSARFAGGTSQHSGNSSFKVPPNLRGGALAGSQRSGKQRSQQPHQQQPQQQQQSSGRPSAIKEERSKQKNDRAGRRSDGKTSESSKHAAASKARKKPSRKAVGAAMRLDRGRTAAPVVDPVEWIANVRMEKDTSNDTRMSDDTFMMASTKRRERGLDRFGSNNVAAALAFGGRDGASTEDDTDAERGLTSQRLGDEIVAINRKLPRIVFERVELAKRICVLTLYGPWADHEPAFLRIKLHFPSAYPRQPPKFELEKSASISLRTRAYLLRGLSRLSSRAAEGGRPCIELCARFLIGEPMKSLDEEEDDDDEDEDEDADVTTSRADGSEGSTTESEDELPVFRPARANAGKPKVKTAIPPRRMGASFGPNNELVVFGGVLLRSDSRASSQQGSRVASRAASRAVSQTRYTGTVRSKSVSAAARARSQSRARIASSILDRQDYDNDEDRSNGDSDTKGPQDEAEEESRFLRSYTALSNAMASLAKYSRIASEDMGGMAAGYGIRDSDVVQLMSNDFFARRLLKKKDFFDDLGLGRAEHPGESVKGTDKRKGGRRRGPTTFYSGSGASTPGAGGGGRRGNDGPGSAAEDNDDQEAGANTLHHADLRGSLPAPAAILALNRLRDLKKRKAALVTIYQFVETTLSSEQQQEHEELHAKEQQAETEAGLGGQADADDPTALTTS
ncbi:WD40 repeat-like protein [Testicularia cyperi]|uniref:WD40 repeat-like protein n=1 Tax=Testicularia cyperi TaxID=1882483 RepID=A0A317XUH2_9BASI|nr:WD40 repeat-like protein [Testicularia cyperi]